MNIEFMGGPFDGEVREFEWAPLKDTVLDMIGYPDYNECHRYRVDDNGRAWYMPPEGVTT